MTGRRNAECSPERYKVVYKADSALFFREIAHAYRKSLSSSSAAGRGGSISGTVTPLEMRSRSNSSDGLSNASGMLLNVEPGTGAGNVLVPLPSGTGRPISLQLAASKARQFSCANNASKQNAPRSTAQPAASLGSHAWLRQVVELAREHEVRSLAIEVVKSATREATKGAFESVMAACGVEPSSGQGVTPGPKGLVGRGKNAAAASIVAIMHRLCILLTVLIVLLIYCISPTIL